MHISAFDAKKQHYLRSVISNLPVSQQLQLKNIRLCSVSVKKNNSPTGGVFILKNSSKLTTFFGITHCKNSWCCPHCTSLKLSKATGDISAAIELRKKQGFAAVMLTLTIPHLSFMSCREVTDVLYQSYHHFFAGKVDNRRQNSQSYKLFTGCEITDYIKACEYTWGENGWHPHFHMLLFVPKKNLSKLSQLEYDCQAQWLKYVSYRYKSYWKKHNLADEKRETFFNTYFVNNKGNMLNQTAFKFTKTKEGSIADCDCSAYIAGWGADREIVSNYQKKASHDGHYSPDQILELAMNGDIKMQQLYIEFMLQVTRKPVHRRIEFARQLLKDVKKYKQTEKWQELSKKKSEKWEVVAWLSVEQWLRLCDLDKNSPIFSNTLYLASLDDGGFLLYRFLEFYDIWLEERPPEIVKWAESFFNKAA